MYKELVGLVALSLRVFLAAFKLAGLGEIVNVGVVRCHCYAILGS